MVRPQHRVRGLALAALLSVGGGCAKDATSVLVTVDADPSVPPILILRTTIARADDPSIQTSADRVSLNQGDAADRPAPYLFPIGLDLTVSPSFAGAVTVTIQGIDWDTAAVTAGASTAAVVEAQKTTRASLTLEPVRGAIGDAGAD